jgi:hemoglobin/transferrin/lactoferrin receptor protein
MQMIRKLFLYSVLVVLVFALIPSSNQALAQEKAPEKAENKEKEDKDKEEPKKSGLVQKVIVTATRIEEDVFQVPQPVSVVSKTEIEEQTPNTAADLLRNLPGVDVNGVGTNQPRPIIRGQRGQRILLLEDGIRMNTSRRQSDFGELPALVDVNSMDRVEVVRGPGSVLYGSDAIGGVVNMITTQAPKNDGVNGSLNYRFSSVDSQIKAGFEAAGRNGKFGYVVGATYRNADSYEAPAGSYGDITLDDKVLVNDSGVLDETYNARFSWDFANGHELFVKAERYASEDAGFGFVEPTIIDPSASTRVALTYPFQKVNQYVVGYSGNGLDKSWVDSVETTLYVRDNERRFDQDIDITFFPGAGMEILSENFTDIETFGLRSELSKLAGSRHILTYGLDYFKDNAESTNMTTTTISFGGPPTVTVDNTPTLPNATYASYGLFIQDRIKLFDKFDAIIGGRFQDVTAKTKTTPLLPATDNFESNDSTGVWATNLIYTATDHIKIVGSFGTAFRSPNLIERFFDGPTPEGGAFQARNLDLEAETAFNVDLGFKYRRENVYLETTIFRNTIKDGIAIEDTGLIYDPGGADLPIYQNVNVDELRFEGVEVALDWMMTPSWTLGFNYTHLTGRNISSGLDEAIGNSYSDKYNARVRYHPLGRKFWVEYQLRRNGEQDDAALTSNPIGDVYPAFTVHSLHSSIRLHETRGTVHRLGIAIENLTDELYAEFSNASFFRPEPQRSLVVNYVFNFK